MLWYPAKPSYSHCVELGRSDCHFSTATRVKKTVTPPTDKTVTVLALVSYNAFILILLVRGLNLKRHKQAKIIKKICIYILAS